MASLNLTCTNPSKQPTPTDNSHVWLGLMPRLFDVRNSQRITSRVYVVGETKQNLVYTCEVTADPLPPLNILSVVQEPIAVMMAPNTVFSSFTLHFKSRQDNGLILYGESEGSYVGVELLTGKRAEVDMPG